MYKFFIILLFLILHQTATFSKINEKKLFNQRYLSNYFSAILSKNNNNGEKALKYFNQSKSLSSNHKNFLKNYVFVLVENNQVAKAVKELKSTKDKKFTNFFEAKLLLFTDSIHKNDFLSAQNYLMDIKSLSNGNNYEKIIYETLNNYLYLFMNNERAENNPDYGKLSLIFKAFQECYLNNEDADQYFYSLLNSENNDYSRYLFFYFDYLFNKKEIQKIKNISETINIFDTNLLIAQSKKWVENEKYYKFSEFFSCQKPNNLISEFYFIISNLYSSQENFNKSNFYLSISNFLNPKFYFNLSLKAENYFLLEKYDKSSSILNKIGKNEQIYKWYKIKKKAQIVSLTKDEASAIKYIEKNLPELKNLNEKVYFDLGNIYKNFKKYRKSIEYYDMVLRLVENNTFEYADTLYRRGSSFERLGDYFNSDRDLINSLNIKPKDPYILNYLGYSWLERKFKLEEAINMLKMAYNQKKDDPYIADSLGWAYFIIGNYQMAEKFLNQAIQLRPADSVIVDHYGDTLWMLGRKIQAKYYWKNVLNSENSTDIDKISIKKKLLHGLNNS